MKDRIMQIVQYKTNGRMGRFGELVGWSAQYTHRVLKEGCIGLQPVVAIVTAFPDIDARWLLTGQGSMVSNTYSYSTLSRKALDVMRYEKFLCVMTDEEINSFVNTDAPIDAATLDKWQQLLNARNARIDKAFADAYNKLSNEHTAIANRS